MSSCSGSTGAKIGHAMSGTEVNACASVGADLGDFSEYLHSQNLSP